MISQKPLATTLADAEAAVTYCAERDVPLFVHENFRWQTPIRAVKEVLSSGAIGDLFRVRLEFSSAFPVFDNQPFLRELDQFILADVGSHLFDVVRFLMGEARSIACQTNRVHSDIRGEDVATALIEMRSGATVTCELSYASRLAVEAFPQTLVRVEGSTGSAELLPGYQLRVTTEGGTTSREAGPPHYPWADPAYDVIHSSIVDCHANLLAAIRGVQPAETSGRDNLASMQLVFAAYESAARGETIHLNNDYLVSSPAAREPRSVRSDSDHLHRRRCG